MRRVTAALGGVLLLGTGCLDTRGYSADGYHCDSDADCDAPSYCFRQRCEKASAVPTKPGPNNTGAPPDLVLTLSGGLDISEAGAVIQGLDIHGCVTIRAPNVTLRNSKIRCDSYYVFTLEGDTHNLLVEDVDIDGAGFNDGIAFPINDGTGRRLNIYNAGRGASLGDNSRLESSYIHDLVGPSDIGINSSGGQGISVFGNLIVATPQGDGAAILMDGALGHLANVTVERNWLDGGRIVVGMGAGAQGTANATVTLNRMGRHFRDAPFDVRAGAVQFKNVWDDTGEEIPTD